MRHEPSMAVRSSLDLPSRPQQDLKTNGGVPPFGHKTHLRVFIDPDLLEYDEEWAAAGTRKDNFGAAPANIARVAGGTVTDLKRAWVRQQARWMV